MTQSTVTATRPPVLHQRTVAHRPPIPDDRAPARLILAGVGYWLVSSFIDNPALFTTSAIVGLQNGTLFALIALGYTLVYGIIELINFAHGDLFMLGTLFAGFVITTVFGVTVSGASALGWILFLVALDRVHGLLRVDQRVDRVRRLPPAAAGAQARAADHGRRHELRAALLRPAVERLRAEEQLGERAPAGDLATLAASASSTSSSS